jgi:glycosyltransferase involved in cell wall biosynthesis
MSAIHQKSNGTPAAADCAQEKRAIRVLFLNDTSRNGGPGRTLFFLLKHLDPKEVERWVVVPREGDVADLLRQGRVTERLTLEPDLIENLVEPWNRPLVRSDFDAPWLRKGVRAIGNVGRASRALWRLRALIRRDHVDVIFCNGTTANFAGASLAVMTGVPAVWHVFYTSVAPIIAPVHARLARLDAVRSILCVSEPARRQFDRTAAKVRVVHDAIDTCDFDPDLTEKGLRPELGIRRDAVVLTSQGRIVPRKGYVEMIRAVALATRWMSADERSRVRVVVFGDTPEDTRCNHLEECRALVRELGLSDVMSFVGYRSDIKRFIADSDVVVVPSVYEDPLPRSVLEAMALGRPIVAFGVGGIPEMVEDGATGLLAGGRPPDVDGLANHMLTYVRRPDLRATHGAAARARAVREFDSVVHGRRIQKELVDVAMSRTGAAWG